MSGLIALSFCCEPKMNLSRGCRAAQRYSPRRGRRRRSARLSSRKCIRSPQGSASARRIRPRSIPMIASRIEARAVVKVVAVVLVALAVALLLQHVVLEVRTTIRWLFAAIFLALALSPLVDLIERARVRGRSLPRWLAILVAYVLFLAGFVFLVLAVIPPIVREVEQLGSQLPTYVKDFESWASNNEQFRELNDKYDITKLLTQEASQLPAKLGDAAGAAKEITVGLLNNLIEAVVVLTLTYFLLLDGQNQFRRATARLRDGDRDRVRRVAGRIAAIVRSYVSVNVLLAALAGVFTWLSLELLGVDLAVPLAVLVAFLDLVPLIGFSIGGLLVAIVAALHDFPTALIVWLVLFVVYQQLQDRVIQPLFYRRAVSIQPAIAIIAVLAGAQLAGILGALLAIPTAAALGAIFDELWPRDDGAQDEAVASAPDAPDAPDASPPPGGSAADAAAPG
ncbi:MAG: AI-2E family transporter [Solirubrobacterales bacterium]|nr:AI-2E family transporter [Solirubrobacterales bacterium]